MRVCQVTVTRTTRKVFLILIFVFGTCRSFSGRHTVPFVPIWNRAQNRGRHTGPLVEKLVAKLTTVAHDLVAKDIFWSQMATRQPDFPALAGTQKESVCLLKVLMLLQPTLLLLFSPSQTFCARHFLINKASSCQSKTVHPFFSNCFFQHLVNPRLHFSTL